MSVKTQSSRCFDCANPPCSAPNCLTCKICRDPECTSPNCIKQVTTLHSKHLPATYEDVLVFRCARCTTLQCDICKKFKPDSSFPKSAIRHGCTKDRNIRCLDCSNPPCHAYRCKTCSTCRNPKCQRQNRCTANIQTLNSQWLPKTRAEVDDFFCERCRFIKCIVKKADGTFCSKERKGFKAQARARKEHEHYKCGECQTWLFSQDSLKSSRR